MNKEELINKYIKYDSSITEEVFNKIVKKLEELYIPEFSKALNFSDFKGDNFIFNLNYGGKGSYLGYVINDSDIEIKVSDILGEEIKFEVGKWYKYNNWYIKLKEITHANIFIASDYIDNQKIYAGNLNSFTCGDADFQKVLLTDLSEIQQYLPDGHPDKIAKEFVLPEKWYIKTTEESNTIVCNWIDSKGGVSDRTIGNYYTCEKKGWMYYAPERVKSYIEITFEQFKQYVLKEPKPLTVDNLVEGEIYYCENTYLTGGKNGYVFLKNGDNGIKHLIIEGLKFLKKGWSFWTDKDTINLRATTPEEKHWLLTCIKQDKFVPKEDLSKYDSEGNLITKNDVKQKQVVHCTNEDQWNFVQKKYDPTSNWPWHNSYDKEGYCKRLDTKGYSEHLDYYKKDPEYKILSFQEWLDLNGYTFTGRIANKFNIGDEVQVCSKSEDLKGRGFLNSLYDKVSPIDGVAGSAGRIKSFKKHAGTIYYELYCFSKDSYISEDCLKLVKSCVAPKKYKEMQLSDLKNPVFNIGDKVRVVADSLREFNDSFCSGNNSDFKKGYEGVITEVNSCKSCFKEVDSWCQLDNCKDLISCNLLELIEPAKSKVNRNVYYEVETQEQYNEILDWLESKGEILNISARKLEIHNNWKYVVFDLGISGSWSLYCGKKDLLKAEFQFKDKPETQPIKTGAGIRDLILRYPIVPTPEPFELEIQDCFYTQNSRAELKQESKVQNFIPEIPKVKNRFKTSPIKKRSLPEIY